MQKNDQKINQNRANVSLLWLAIFLLPVILRLVTPASATESNTPAIDQQTDSLTKQNAHIRVNNDLMRKKNADLIISDTLINMQTDTIKPKI